MLPDFRSEGGFDGSVCAECLFVVYFMFMPRFERKRLPRVRWRWGGGGGGTNISLSLLFVMC
jgi:hypothetical protein